MINEQFQNLSDVLMLMSGSQYEQVCVKLFAHYSASEVNK